MHRSRRHDQNGTIVPRGSGPDVHPHCAIFAMAAPILVEACVLEHDHALTVLAETLFHQLFDPWNERAQASIGTDQQTTYPVHAGVAHGSGQTDKRVISGMPYRVRKVVPGPC